MFVVTDLAQIHLAAFVLKFSYLILMFHYQIISCHFALLSKFCPPAIKSILPDNLIYNLACTRKLAK